MRWLSLARDVEWDPEVEVVTTTEDLWTTPTNEVSRDWHAWVHFMGSDCSVVNVPLDTGSVVCPA